MAVLASAFVLTASQTACWREGATCVVFDFAAGLQRALIRTETEELDFGTAEAREVFLDGWSVDEKWEGRTSFAWGVGNSSSLRLYRFSTLPATLRFRCRPIVWLGSPPQVVTTILNGWKLGEIQLATGFASYEVAVPGSAIRPGENVLEFRYAFSGSPPTSDAPHEARALAVAWDWLALDGAGESAESGEEAAPQAAEGSLSLPFGAQLDYVLEIRPRSRFRLEGLRSWGSDPAAASRLEVRITSGEASAVQALHFDLATAPVELEVELPVETGDLSQVSFLARGAGSSGAIGLHLDAPALVEAGGCRGPATSESRVRGRLRHERGARPNVLVYLIDTLRADSLGAYGCPRPVSPNIDAFATESTVFAHAFAQSGWTKTSVASILTGLTPFSHRVLDRSDALPENMPFLPELLRDLGYETFAAITNPTIAVDFGFGRGFDHFVPLYESMEEDQRSPPRSDRVHAEFASWLRSRAATRAPFFAYLHTMDPHDPYAPLEPFRSRFAPRLHSDLRVPRPPTIATALAENRLLSVEDIASDLRALYDGEVAFNDLQFGRLLRELKEAGLYDSTLIVLVSDHGEEFLDHGHWGHGHSLYSELLRIPLIIKLPKSPGRGRTVTAVAQHVDVVPTILAALDAAVPPDLAGQSLLPVLTDPDHQPPERVVLSLLQLDDYEISSAIYRQRHLLRWTDDNPTRRLELFDLREDPRELRDVRQQQRLWEGYLFGRLGEARKLSEGRSEPPQAVVGEEAEERLRALGYLQ